MLFDSKAKRSDKIDLGARLVSPPHLAAQDEPEESMPKLSNGSLVSAVVCALGLVLASHPAALGQSSMGSVAGTVTDSTGAVVGGAEVTLVNEGTNGKRQTHTTDA